MTGIIDASFLSVGRHYLGERDTDFEFYQKTFLQPQPCKFSG